MLWILPGDRQEAELKVCSSQYHSLPFPYYQLISAPVICSFLYPSVIFFQL